MKYQVTLFCKRGKYKPVSCIIENNRPLTNTTRPIFLKFGAEKICRVRGWSNKDLARYEYTSGKIREYNPEKIAAENAARYEKIKEAKYASGEWKRPKNKREEKED